MSARMGRPTTDPKTSNIHVRLSEEDIRRLEYSAEVLGVAKAEIIRQGIDLMYQKALKVK